MMKTTSTKPVVGGIPVSKPISKASIAPGSCFVPLPSHAEINSQWCAKAKTTKLDDGANSHVERFAQIMERIHATKKSFTFSELCYVCRGAELELSEIRRLWDSWKDYAVQHCIVEVIQGCMDEETIIFNF
jgi:hypothetical protein